MSCHGPDSSVSDMSCDDRASIELKMSCSDQDSSEFGVYCHDPDSIELKMCCSGQDLANRKCAVLIEVLSYRHTLF